MLGFGVFLLVLGILLLVLNPLVGLFLMLISALFIGFGAIAKKPAPGRPLTPRQQYAKDEEVAFWTRRKVGEVKAERLANERRPCPMCAEAILPAAKICPNCKSPLAEGWGSVLAK